MAEMESPQNPQKVDVIANLFEVTVRRIQQLTQEGILPTVETDEGRRYDLVPTIQRYIRHLSNKAKGKTEHAEKFLELQEKKLKVDIALRESQGELHRLKTAIEQGKYIAVEEVTADLQRFMVQMKKWAMSLPVKLADAAKSGTNMDPIEVRRFEKNAQTDVRRYLEAFVVAGVTELPSPKKKKTQSGKKTREPKKEAAAGTGGEGTG